MAKKSMLIPAPSPLDDPFDGRALPDQAPVPPPPPRRGPGCAGLLGGCIEIVIIAAIVLLSCGLLSGAMVLLGQRTGVLADAPESSNAMLAALPTVEPLNIPTLPAIIPTSSLRPTSEPGVVQPAETDQTPACADGAMWWRDHQPDFDFFASTLFSATVNTETPAALLAQATPRRVTLAEAETPRCLEGPQAALLRGADAALAGLNAATAGDSAAYEAQVAAGSLAFADVLTGLWDVGVFTAPDAPTTRAIARGTAEDCAPDDWYTDFSAQVTDYRATAANAVPGSAPLLSINVAIGQMNLIANAAAALEAPVCMGDVEGYGLAWMTGRTEALSAFVAGDIATAQASAIGSGSALVRLNAWIDWLGLPPL
ncbi:MAG TPA: hypothetical protein VER79_01435 [Candidatus Limnocylindrales bacterium]|nr:hypothetical protein [Candidatus Limnocylindrales bacterium]